MIVQLEPFLFQKVLKLGIIVLVIPLIYFRKIHIAIGLDIVHIRFHLKNRRFDIIRLFHP